MPGSLDLSPFVRRVGLFVALSDRERRRLRSLEAQIRRVPARTELVRQGDPQRHCLAVRDGWAARAKLLSDGRRQITSLVLPGDLVGVFTDVAGVADRALVAVTELEVAEFPAEAVMELFLDQPKLAVALAWTTARDEAMLAEKAATLGRRTARERVIHFLLELYERLRLIGRTAGTRFTLPISQEVIADALGLSPVHVNRTLIRLRSDGLIRMDGAQVELCDLAGLRGAVDFEDIYLLHRRMPPPLERRLAA